MRLIDKDALPIVAHGKIDHNKYVFANITDAPTIEAIPVEWLARNAMLNSGCLINQYQMVLCEWQKEQEAR